MAWFSQPTIAGKDPTVVDSFSNLFKKFLVGENQFHNEIVAQLKISIQMDFYEYLMKL